jgi:excisionase family DNA binding protein
MALSTCRSPWRRTPERVNSENDKSTLANDEILTLRELAAYLKVNPRTVYRLLSERRLPAFRVGHAWRFRKRDIDSWMAVGGTPDGEDGRADG